MRLFTTHFGILINPAQVSSCKTDGNIIVYRFQELLLEETYPDEKTAIRELKAFKKHFNRWMGK